MRDFVLFPVTFEHLLAHLFGNDKMHGKADKLTVDGAKKYYRRVVTALKHASETNIIGTDCGHREALRLSLNMLEAEIKRARTAAVLQAKMNEGLIRLCFELLGGMPDNWRKKRVTKNDWKLDRYLSYGQTRKQKVELIRCEALKKLSGEARTELDLEFGRMAGKSIDKQFDWARMRCPEVYARLYVEESMNSPEGRSGAQRGPGEKQE